MIDISESVSEELKQFIQWEIVQGRFGSPTEVIQAGLLLLKEREMRLAQLS